jgi:uncharacterized membrane protein YraQ (UPF0718 family)
MTAAFPPRRRLAGRYQFLLLVMGLYLIASLIDPGLVRLALIGFAAMMLRVLPLLVLVFLVLVIVNLFLKPERLRRHLGAESGFKGWFWAIVAGIFISGPPYVLYPMLEDFRKQGVRSALLAVFLYNRNVKLQYLPAMAYYFGIRYTVVLSVYIILFSLISGKLVEMLVERHEDRT